MRIYLIGYMGSGKSTLGAILAELLDLKWVDLDSEIETTYKINITVFFKKYGETAFRIAENAVLQQIIKLDNVVVSTGGGTPCFNNNLDLMKSSGFTIFLDTSAQVIYKRLSAQPQKRPLFQEISLDTSLEKLKNHMESRMIYYKQAHFSIDAESLDLQLIKTAVQIHFNSIS